MSSNKVWRGSVELVVVCAEASDCQVCILALSLSMMGIFVQVAEPSFASVSSTIKYA